MTSENIQKECIRIEEDAEHSAKRHYNASSIWLWVHYGIGIPMTVCAAWAGIDAFSQEPYLAGYLALSTAALGALQTFMNASGKASTHKSSGDGYLTLRNDTRFFREIELPNLEIMNAIQKIREFAESRNELNNISSSTPGIAFWLAKRGIDNGETQYRADTGKQL